LQFAEVVGKHYDRVELLLFHEVISPVIGEYYGLARIAERTYIQILGPLALCSVCGWKSPAMKRSGTAETTPAYLLTATFVEYRTLYPDYSVPPLDWGPVAMGRCRCQLNKAVGIFVEKVTPCTAYQAQFRSYSLTVLVCGNLITIEAAHPLKVAVIVTLMG
jgi:hypothetical protein